MSRFRRVGGLSIAVAALAVSGAALSTGVPGATGASPRQATTTVTCPPGTSQSTPYCVTPSGGRKCTSRRNLTYHFKSGSRHRRLTVNRKRRTLGSHPSYYTVSFVGLPKTTVNVRLYAMLDGKPYYRLSQVHTCGPPAA